MKTKLFLLLITVFTLSNNAQTFDWETATLNNSGANPAHSASQNINSTYFATFNNPNSSAIQLANSVSGFTGKTVVNTQLEPLINLSVNTANGSGLNIQSIKVAGTRNNKSWTFKSLDAGGNVLQTKTATVNTTGSVVTLNWTNVVLIQISRTDGASENFYVDDIVFTPYTAPCTVNIPDATFKAALVANTAINTNGDTEIQCSEASTFTGVLDVNNSGISDLTGIEAFTEITELKCNGNNIATIDVSFNTKITLLNVASCQLTALNLSTNTVLNTLWAQANQFSSLDLSGYTSLNFISLGSNPLLSSLNVANGNNSNIPSNSFAANNNPNLTCITVDNVAYSTTNWTYIDAQTSFNTNCPAQTCTVNIPDSNFKSYLVANTSINTNGDSEIQCNEATAFTGTLNVTNKSIADLTGLESFTALTKLYCITNSLTSLDVSQNTALTDLQCGNNSLTTLDLSQNTALTKLDCSYNSISSINLSNNTLLEQIQASNNQLSSINVSANTQLTSLRVGNNLISSIDVSTNSSLLGIEVNDNQLTNLNVSSNLNLVHLYAQNNNITNLDISLNAALNYLNASNNNLTTLNLANGNNSNFYDASNGGGSGNPAMDARQNSNLTCIKIDAGFTPPNSPASSRWEKDAAASFNTSCSTCSLNVNIPDVNFKSYLVANSNINTDNNTEISCVEATSFRGTIRVTSLGISDLTGIEAFTNIKVLFCDDNSISTLDVSTNTALEELYCDTNSLTSLDVSNNIALETLSCPNNSQLVNLNVSGAVALTKITCVNNTSLTNLDVSTNIALENLFCYSNALTSLDISNNTALIKLYCYANALTSLNLANGNNVNMYIDANYPNFANNPNLSCIQVDDVNYANTNWSILKDATASFSANCAALSLDNFTLNEVSIYPNPTTSILNIKMDKSLKRATIYSVLGAKILETSTKNITTSNLKRGLYLIKIESENGSISTKRFMKE